MGRKGVSKRKPRQNKTKPLPNDRDNDSASAVVQTAVKSQPVKSFDTGKAAIPSKGGKKNLQVERKNLEMVKKND